ncbi:MAG: RNA methyltransferase [Planctomycetaceae bacterium]|jgi:TrmH family RNA methyltransferase|nr:RNA methyltransferase [Planctomycetaceae bacterium]
MFTEISSSSNRKIKEVIKLRDSKYRRNSGRFLIDGIREIERACCCGIKILEVFGNKETINNFAKKWEKNVSQKDSFYSISNVLLEKISFGNRNEGIVVVAEIPKEPAALTLFEAKICSVSVPLLAVLERIEKPGNSGAVFRSADGAGLDGIIVADSMTDLYNPNTIRSSLGTIFRIPHAAMDSISAINWLRQHKIRCAVSRCNAAVPYTDYDFCQPTAIVLGNEAEGLSDIWYGNDVTTISIPMRGIADSLNVSNAAAILFYEAQRQRL